MTDDYYTKDDFDDELDLEEDRFDQVPDEDVIEETISNVEEGNVDVHRFESAEAARDHLVDQIPEGATVMDGHSTTLEEISFTDVLEAADGFEYLGNRIADIDDDEERADARREAATADVFFDSVNAIARSGELLGANALGNAVSAWPFAAERLVLVGSANKIEPSWAAAVERVREFALPLEDARAEEVYGQGSTVGKLVSLERERVEDRTQLVLLEDRHGF
ncbi:LUD domain-containing protein [Saliphagus sp. GCM10025317]